jgi:hypothetical protein
VPSGITLDRLHEVVQAAVGWTDSHLHRFSTHANAFEPTTEAIVTPNDVDEGEDGVLESEVRLHELVQDADDTLHYTYDFGDDWRHTLRLEKIEARDAEDNGCSCLAGSFAAPPEDSGGIHFYQEMLAAAADAGHPDHADMAERMRYYNVTAASARTFDVAQADRAVRRVVDAGDVLAWLRTNVNALPAPLTELFDELGGEAQRWLAGLVSDAALAAPVEQTDEGALDATRVIRTLLDHVGDDDVALTAAGYLPPASVGALMKQLDPEQRWRGPTNREAQTYPLLALREITTRLGLLRAYRGRLVPTKAAQKLRRSPVGLWWHIARRLPLEKPEHGRDASVFLMLTLAADEPISATSLESSLDLFTAMLGWQLGGSGRYGNADAIRYIRDTQDVLAWAATGTVTGAIRSQLSLQSPPARLLARAALSPLSADATP